LTRTLYGRLSLALMAVMGGVLLLTLLASMRSQQLALAETTQRLYRDLARELVRNADVGTDAISDLGVLGDEIDLLMRLNPRLEIYLLDLEGRLVAHSAPPGRLQVDRVSLGPIRRFLSGRDALPIRGDDPRHPGRAKVFSAAAIGPEGRTGGYLYVILEGEAYQSISGMLGRSQLARTSATSLGAVSLFGLAAGLLLFRTITRRLGSLGHEVETFMRGDASDPLPPGEGGDEIERLTRAFAHLRRRVERQVGELEQVDRLRRELVANVSHDLRGPLSALRGYLDTLSVMDDEMGAEERRRYLEAALRHTERLSRLVGDLLELAHLDAEGVPLQPEPFHPAELLQDIVRKFELAAHERGIDLSLEDGRDLPLALADLRLLERVFENLLDNALRHTPRGGRVTLALRRLPDAVGVEVADTGPGIPAEDVPRIFERFTRLERERTDSTGMGLGLAIVRRILELHGRSIGVTSEVGVGTRFSFSLPLAPAGRGQPPRPA